MLGRRSFLVFLGFRLFSGSSWPLVSGIVLTPVGKNLPNFVNLDGKEIIRAGKCASHVKENHHQMISKVTFLKPDFSGSPLQPLSSGHLYNNPKKGHDRRHLYVLRCHLISKTSKNVIWKLSASIINHPQNKYISGQIRPTIPFNLNVSVIFGGIAVTNHHHFGGKFPTCGLVAFSFAQTHRRFLGETTETEWPFKEWTRVGSLGSQNQNTLED